MTRKLVLCPPFIGCDSNNPRAGDKSTMLRVQGCHGAKRMTAPKVVERDWQDKLGVGYVRVLLDKKY